jgi:hypothetical protein
MPAFDPTAPYAIFHGVHDVGLDQAFFSQVYGEIIARGWFIYPGFGLSDVVA